MQIPNTFTRFCLATVAAALLVPAPPVASADESMKWSRSVADHFLGPYVMLVSMGRRGKLALIVGPNDNVFPTKLPDEAKAETATFDLVVSTDGTVKSAIRRSKPSAEDMATGNDNVAYQLRTWRFRPFMESGQPASVTLKNVPVVVARSPIPQGYKIQYPAASEADGVRVRLQHNWGSDRGARGGTAIFEINNDGAVTYAGGGLVAVAGEHRTQIGTTEARALIETLTALDPIQDAGKHGRGMFHGYDTDTITIQFAGRDIFHGRQTNVLQQHKSNALDVMGQAIRQAVDSERWTRGNGQTIASLRSEGENFRANATLVESAAEMRNEPLVRELIALGAPISPTALATGAGKWGGPKLARHMIAHGASASEALPIAVKRHDFDAVQTLAALQTNPDRDALTEAMLTMAGLGKTEIVRLLVRAGAHPQGTKFGNNTLLMEAASAGDIELVSFALEQGIDPKARSNWPVGATALQRAVARNDRESDRLKIIAKLLAAGADVNAHDYEHATPLMHAVRSEPIVAALIAAGARIDAVDDMGRTALTRGCPTVPVARTLVAAGLRLSNPSQLERLRECWSKEDEERGRDVIDLLSKKS